MGHAVAGDAAFALGGHQAMGAETHQVLADRGLRTAKPGGELGDVQRTFLEGLDDAETIRVGKRAESARTVTENLRVERARLGHIQKIECVFLKVKRR